jgi:MFS family permease
MGLYVPMSVALMVFTYGAFSAHRGGAASMSAMIGGAVGLVAIFVLAGWVMLRRPGAARGDDDPRARVVQILAITGSIALVSVGLTLASQADPHRFLPSLPHVLRAVGAGCVITGTLLLFVGLLVAPTSATELTRRIHLEASTTALGTVFVASYFYPSVANALGLPHLSIQWASAAIMFTYLLARLCLSFRYRTGSA